jgi:hypothetical protein
MRAEINPNLAAIRGKMGPWVYRQLDGQTVISAQPKRQKRKPSDLQSDQRESMEGANRYAKRILDDPWRRRAYQDLARRLGRRYDRLPVSDFMNPPRVEEIDVSAYKGQVGDLVTIWAVDDVEVVSVELIIRDAAGVTIESGPAYDDHGVWRYAAKVAVPAGSAVRITAIAKDRPGHTGEQTITHLLAK